MSRDPKDLDLDPDDGDAGCPMPDHGREDAVSPCCRPQRPADAPRDAVKPDGWWRRLIGRDR